MVNVGILDSLPAKRFSFESILAILIVRRIIVGRAVWELLEGLVEHFQ